MRAALNAFLETPLDELLRARTDPRAAAIELFKEVAREVPAYRQFLAEHGVDPNAIATAEDFARLPLVTKDNYVKRYPLASLCRGGELLASDMIAISSGSTGAPTSWPRSVADEFEITTRFEQLFVDSFGADTTPTLAVVCFPLGTWIGGMFTAACCRHLATKGYPIFTATPGNAKAEIFRVVQELGPQFEQTVLLGYPPFMKDVVDSGPAAGITWRDRNVKLVLAGEVFTEEWRTLMGARAGMTRPLLDSVALYGTADAGVLGNETPVTIAIRRFLADRPEDARSLFGQARLPTLVQYDPLSRYFEEHEGTLVFSGNNGVPLVRYHISDTGGVMPFEVMMEKMRALGCDPIAIAKAAGARVIREQPFAWVFGRSHFAVSYFGANIFPEMVSVALEQPELVAHITGKFVMEVKTDADHNAALHVAIELASGVSGTSTLEDALARSIESQLVRLNSEFSAYVPKERQRPNVTLLATGDPEYFPLGVKHRYSR
jgi:phenylacetate-CoA ligase